MNYQVVYILFITSRLLRQDDLVHYERHHILPRCLGGGNEMSNIIRLKPEEHLFAHILLAKIHGGLLAVSAVRMLGMKKYAGRRSRLEYADLRRKHGEETSKRQIGKPIKWTPEARKRAIETERVVFNTPAHKSRLKAQAQNYSRRPSTRTTRSIMASRLNTSDPLFREKKLHGIRRRFELRREALTILEHHSLPSGCILPINPQTGGTTNFWFALLVQLRTQP